MSLRGIWLRVRSLLAPGRVDRELDDELRFHLEMETEKNVRLGMRPSDARREAYRSFGGVERFKEQTREVSGTRWADDLARDTRHGLRALLRGPGFATAALLTIALGVGATTAVFSVVRGVLLLPLPYADPDRFVSVWLHNPQQGIDEDITSYPDFAAWREQGTALSHVVAVRGTRTSLTGDGPPEEVRGASVTRGFFDMLGVPLALGRGFRPEESEGDAASDVVVLSHELWTRRYAADPGLIGRTILLNDVPHEVVGVAAPGAAYPPIAELWTPLSFARGSEQLREMRGALWLPVVGRLADGVSLEEAQAQMSEVAARLAEHFPDDNEGMGIKLERMRDSLVGDVRSPLLILLGAVVLVLLIAAANVANLMLARGTVRGREMAVRLALGAGKGRVTRQVLAESAVLGVVGGAFGVLLAVGGVRVLLRLAPADLPRLRDVAVDLPVLAFALLVALGTSLLFGVVPALQAGGHSVADDLRAGGRGASERGLARLRGVFVAAQFALALVLLVGSGLLVRSFLNLQAVDTGMDPSGVLSFRIQLPSARYPDYEARRGFYDQLIPALEAVPGVERAAAVSGIFKVQLANMAGISLESRPELDGRENPVVYDGATPEILDVLGMRLLSGRALTDADEQESTRVAVVSESFVRTFLPDRDPLGERFLFGTPTGEDIPWITIVGVVADAQRWGVGEPLRPYVFQPMSQLMDARVEVAVRTSGDPATLAEPVREVVGRVDPNLPLTNLRTLEEQLASSLAQRRFLTFLLTVFAGAATALAAVGIYGVMAYLVGRRTREIGIRVAMGAPRAHVVRSVLRDALLQTLAGVSVGLFGAFALTRFLRSQLFGLGPTDPATFAAVSLLLVVVALLATFVPARRAAGVQPSIALRED